jgi:hypothetical protein
MKSPKAVPLASITLTPENSAALAFWTDLTGLSVQEIANHLLASKLEVFSPNNTDTIVTDTLAEFKYADRQSAERVFAWATEHLKNYYRKALKTFSGGADELPDGRFEIYGYRTNGAGRERSLLPHQQKSPIVKEICDRKLRN